MRQLSVCVIGSMGLFFSFNATAQATPINLGVEKQQLIQYHDSGKYDQDITSVTKQAMYYLRFRVNQNQHLSKPNKLAMVLAVDETALSNYMHLKSLNFGGTNADREKLEAKANDPAIEDVLALYDFATSHDVRVFFISNRPERLRKVTLANLKKAGFDKVAHLYLRQPNDNSSITAYKTAIRKQIVKQGFDIAVNMGDQFSDINGGYADMAFKLANPFYLRA